MPSRSGWRASSPALDARGPDESALDTLRSWMATTMNQLESDNADLSSRFWERRAQRAHIINGEPGLRGRARAGY